MTKAQAEEKLRAFIRSLHNQPAAETPQSTLRSLVEDFCKDKSGDWGEHEQKNQRAMFDRVILPALGDRPLEEITAQELKRFTNSLTERKWQACSQEKSGVSRWYAKKVIRTLKQLFDIANENGLVKKNPARSTVSSLKLTIPKTARKPAKPVFPIEEWEPLLTQLDRRGKLLAWLSMLGATRPNELFAVDRSSVIFLPQEDGGHVAWLCVHRALTEKREFKDTKTDKPRNVFLPPLVAEELHSWIQDHRIGPDDLVFPNRHGKPLNNKNLLRRMLRPAAKRAGIRTLNVDWRMLRRSFATWANANEVDLKSIQDQLGHVQPDISIREYIQSVDRARAEQIARLELILRGKQPMLDSARAMMAAGARVQ